MDKVKAKIEVEVEVPEGYVIVDRIVLLKVLDARGEVCWREDPGKTNAMERLGMLVSAADTIRKMLTKNVR